MTDWLISYFTQYRANLLSTRYSAYLREKVADVREDELRKRDFFQSNALFGAHSVLCLGRLLRGKVFTLRQSFQIISTTTDTVLRQFVYHVSPSCGHEQALQP